VRSSCICAALCLGALVAGVRTAAGYPALQFSSHCQETGGLADSVPGDSLWVAGLISGVENAGGLPYAPAGREYTLTIHGLSSNGESFLGGWRSIAYSGGRLEIYADASFNADWAAGHPPGEPPPCFWDGELWLAASVTNFRLTFAASGTSHLSCLLGYEGGTARPWFGNVGYIWAVREPTPADIAAQGYEFSTSGTVCPWPRDWLPESMSAIKALY
jgi:hypothetical protein